MSRPIEEIERDLERSNKVEQELCAEISELDRRFMVTSVMYEKLGRLRCAVKDHSDKVILPLFAELDQAKKEAGE